VAELIAAGFGEFASAGVAGGSAHIDAACLLRMGKLYNATDQGGGNSLAVEIHVHGETVDLAELVPGVLLYIQEFDGMFAANRQIHSVIFPVKRQIVHVLFRGSDLLLRPADLCQGRANGRLVSRLVINDSYGGFHWGKIHKDCIAFRKCQPWQSL